MIALLTTYFVLAYVLIPGVLFRGSAGFLVKLRLFQLTRTQEVTLGVLVAVLPLLMANFAVWHCPVARDWPLPYSFGGMDEYKQDYRLAFGVIVSSDPEKLLQPGHDPKTNYEQATGRIWRRQLRFLFWYFLFSSGEGLLFGYLSRMYGDWAGSNRFYDWLARRVLLPRISEWQLLLTDFTFPKHPKRDVRADVLCADILYRGRVGDYFLDTGGKLSGLFLKDVERFRRKDYEAACIESKGKEVIREIFWRPIPGSNFYIPADKISNLNVRFPLQSADLSAYLNSLVEELTGQTGFTASYEETKTEESKLPDSSQPSQ